MALTADQITAKNFKEFYDRIFPYLNGKRDYRMGAVTAAIPRWLRFDPTNRKGLIIKADTNIRRSNGSYITYSTDTAVDLSSDVTEAGKDYFVNLADDGTITAATSKLTTGVTIGRFHTLCVNVGNIQMVLPASPASGLTTSDYIRVKSYDAVKEPDFYAFYNKQVASVNADSASYDIVTVLHPLNGYNAGDILPESVFCLSWYPECLSEDAMVFDKDTGIAVDIYLQSGTGYNTSSRFNATHTTNRAPINHQEDMRTVGKRLLKDYEFTSAALGSNEATSIAGAADATYTGGHSDTAGRRMVSAIGCEEMCGYVWQWLDEIAPTGGSSWSTYDGRGSLGLSYGVPYVLHAGGAWGGAANCGSRSRDAGGVRSGLSASIGGRGASRVSRFPEA